MKQQTAPATGTMTSGADPVAAMVRSDRAWFQANPWRQFRLRPFSEAESQILDEGPGEWVLVRAIHSVEQTIPELQWLRVGPLRRDYLPGTDRSCWLLWRYYTDSLGRRGVWFRGSRGRQ